MKTTFAFFLLILYMFAMCKPVLPLLQDEIAHIFWKAQHVATVHHHHGDHHAEEEIAEAAHDEESRNIPSTSKISKPVSIHLIKHCIFSIPKLLKEQQKFGSGKFSASSLTLEKHFPPPKISFSQEGIF